MQSLVFLATARVFFLAEKEGFEPSLRFPGLLPEQWSPFGQLVYFSIPTSGGVIHLNKIGGESGIRTHGSCESPVFKTGSLNHSDVSPQAERHQAHQTRVLSYHIRRAMSTVFRKKPGPRGPGPFPVTRKMRARQLWSRRAGSAVPNCWAIYWDLQNTGCFLPL